MKALTMKPPWTWAMLRLGKDYENRKWMPGAHELRPGEWFALHNGKTPKGKARERAEDLAIELAERDDRGAVNFAEVFREGIVGVARFGGAWAAVFAEEAKWFEGPYGWKLEQVIELPTPIVCPGQQGLWSVPRGSRAFLERQVEEMGKVLA